MTAHLSRRALLAACPLMAQAGRRLSIRKLTTRKHSISNRDYLFAEIETDGGITGVGEGSISGRVEIVEKAIQWYAPYLTGKDPGGIEEHWNRNYCELSRYRDGSVLQAAVAAIDIELWEIEAQRLQEPVWWLLGMAAPKPMRVYYSHWSHRLEPRTPARLAELAAQTRAEGWTCVKWVLPRGGTESERLRRLVAEVEAVRKGGGEDLEIALEMWETFSVRSAIDFAKAVALFRPLFIEEPTWRETPQALGEVRCTAPWRWRAGKDSCRATSSNICWTFAARASCSPT
ncbi:MAG: hypothetical protein FJW31_21720 [Acidobacteria bacterium]|nr:hypothetical protein [Acidobacteriota bacterium]